MTVDKVAGSGIGLMPSVFVGVGGPRQMEDEEWCSALNAWAHDMPRPRSILLFSAHWLRSPLTLGATERVPLVYDYFNFPPHYYQVQYPAPPAPELAGRVVDLLGHSCPSRLPSAASITAPSSV